MSVIEEIKYRLKQDNAVIKIIMINVMVFLAFAFINVIFYLIKSQETSQWFTRLFMLPASLGNLIYQPWSIFTYMFLHEGLLHILFNMIWLYWFGQLFQQYLGNSKTYRVYLLGGFFGALLYILFFNIFPAFSASVGQSYALGASAGVLAIVVATATLLPDYRISLFLLGSVKLKYIALFSVLLDLINIPNGNAGGHIAHLGGAAFGYVFIKFLYSKSPYVNAFNQFFDQLGSWFKPKPKMKIHHRTTYMRVENNKKPSQQEIDMILDKISKNGYESLSKTEKEILFKASKD